MKRQLRRQIHRTDDPHALVLDDLARLREFAVAAGFGRDVDDDGAGLHALDRGARDDARRAPAGHGGGA